MKKLLINTSVVAIMFIGCQQNVSDLFFQKDVEVTGVRKANLNEGSQNLEKLQFNQTEPIPGKVKTKKAAFKGAPTMIPHSVEGMLPITKGNNMCLNCHTPQNAKALNVTSIPNTHFVDNKLAGSRFNCTLCHAPQANVNPVIQNKFNSLKNR